MRPTRRGYMIILVCLVALSAGIISGPRALDAVVIPGVVTLFASILDIGRVSEPFVKRTLPSPAEPGTKAQVLLEIEADRPVPVKAIDTIPSGLTGTPIVETIADGTGAEYELQRRDRGRHTIGPVTVRLRDRLGLLERVFIIENTDSVTVFHGHAHSRLRPLVRFGTPLLRQREPSEDHSKGFGSIPVGTHFVMSIGRPQHDMMNSLLATLGVRRIRIVSLIHSALQSTLTVPVTSQLSLLMLRQQQQRVSVLRLLSKGLLSSYKHRLGMRLLLLEVNTQFLSVSRNSQFREALMRITHRMQTYM